MSVGGFVGGNHYAKPTPPAFEYLSLVYDDLDLCNISPPHTCVVPPSLTIAHCIHCGCINALHWLVFPLITFKCESWATSCITETCFSSAFICFFELSLLFARSVFWEWILHSLHLHKLHGPIQRWIDYSGFCNIHLLLFAVPNYLAINSLTYRCLFLKSLSWSHLWG